MKSSVKHFSYGIDSLDQKSTKAPALSNKRKRQGKDLKESERFADLENIYFDSISTKASAINKKPSIKSSRKRSR